ncbi:MAG: PolC-type DNA polymerase III, partial [Eubacteriales bacterium]|nr:PolC-type DNA polymerase III [Eubacteriales bacterium]
AEALAQFSTFLGTATAVAHNASFDMGFLKTQGARCGEKFPQVVVDTLMMSRALFPTMRRHKLDGVCAKLGISLEGHHRAVNDAEATAQVFLKLLEMAKQQFGCQDVGELNRSISRAQGASNDYHTIILVKNKVGLKNLYKLVSDAHLKYFHGRPRMPKALIEEHREGLIIGSACEAGELFHAFLDGKDEEAERIGAFYDYFEIQPDGNNMFLLRSGRLANLEALHNINRKIIALGEKQKKWVVATGDVHFINPQDEYFRRILQSGQGFTDADNQPPLYYRNTAQMLDEFAWLGEEKAYEVVVTATNAVADMIEAVEPLPPYKLYAPHIDGAEEEVVRLSWETAHRIYGDDLPEQVEKRLDKELGAITKYGFGVLFYIAQKLVEKSLSDDYLVGSRGSVGSSFVATMTGITEVNPLPPHYVCPNCRHSDWNVDTEQYAIGPDLPDAVCPECGAPYKKDGFDIPFEVFLGFEGDKVPDIDLNFSGEYQPTMHHYTEELFGKEYTFRAGTIGTVADRTAYGYVKHYLEERGRTASRAEMDRLVAGCAGVKRTTGQHPAGMIVVPKEYDIYDFTPIQHPADDKESDIITTHFDFNSLHDRLVKLDILGHDDPTMLRMLKDLTGIDPRSIDITDPDTMRLFSSTESLGVTPEQINSKMGTFGVPEFGTKFVRGMLEDTMPTTMSELVRISGLSHGTDVWLGNAQDIIRSGTATLKEAVCTRDDIMNALMHYGVEPKMAFTTMESVRKGKGLKPEMEEAMKANNVPEWFIDSCKKIKYMFPKAHAVAYVTMGLRVAWYKVHHPKEYYAAYYTVRADDFDAGLMLGELDELKRNIDELEKLDDVKQKDKNKLTILEIVLEMRCRGIQFAGIDLYDSQALKFEVMEDGRIRPPLNALPGLGDNAAFKIVEARQEGEFRSEEDLKKRAGVSSAVIGVLREFHCIDGMSKTDQMSLFDML